MGCVLEESFERAAGALVQSGSRGQGLGVSDREPERGDGGDPMETTINKVRNKVLQWE